MKHDFRIALFTGLFLVLGVWAVSRSESIGEAAKGKPIYEKNCLICHGPQGRGDGPMGGSLKPPATNFASPESRQKSDAELLKVIREGHPETAMTAWKSTLSEQNFIDVLAYVRQLGLGVDKGKS